MVRIRETQRMILATGHAESREKCGIFSGVCVAVANAMDMAGEASNATDIGAGSFYINKEEITTDKGRFLADVFMKNARILAEQYPNSFEISD